MVPDPNLDLDPNLDPDPNLDLDPILDLDPNRSRPNIFQIEIFKSLNMNSAF